MLTSKRSIRYFDWAAFFLTLCIMAMGLLFVFSATYKETQPYSLFFKKQAFGIMSGVCIYLFFSAIDYRWFMQWSLVAYLCATMLLIITIIKGSVGMGGQRWINLVFFKIQPSELIKLFFPIFAGTYLYNNRNYFTYSLSEFMPIIGSLIVSFVLIRKQPDLGTALIILFSGLIILWLAGINKKFFTYGFMIIMVTAPFSWNVLKPYQKQRVLVFLGQGERSKERYQIEQSKIAIGSGGITGKGFLKGTQNKLYFLPESRTDFIFSVICEEMGFLGAFGILLLYLFLFTRLITRVSRIAPAHIQLLAISLIIPIAVSAVINICMVIGLLPVVGIPLPLMSYGLSNLWVTCATLGCFNAIVMHQMQAET